ncbi:MAG: helix-turn-helix transcriptional regulator [Lachnospiraceae bacterium]|nr:helix-turn-helix transcriptional regulator [Lachnospiraceae bacterium]
MLPIYKEITNKLEIRHKKCTHISPHLHNAIECVYVSEGTLAIGIGTELYQMKEGDFAIIFPDLVHHYQAFETGRAMYLFADTSLSGPFYETLQKFCPECPIISKKMVDEDIVYALNSLLRQRRGKTDSILQQAFIQIILARSIPFFSLIEKSIIGSNDIVYQTISYISSHFKEKITLTKMARDLGFSPYSISRVFSGTFHKNFNQYVNEIRLDYACVLLIHTMQSITDIYGNAGFESQRTFNRVFFERYHMSPRDYRNQHKKLGIDKEME